MIITNNNNIPQSVFHWVKKFNQHNEEQRAVSILQYGLQHSGKFHLSISCTTMIKPMQEVILTDRHYNEMTREASDILDSIMGVAVHASFETMPLRENETRELRVGTVMKEVLVHGQFDNLFNNEISDYKTTKVGGYIFGDKEFEFTAQLSIVRYLLLADKAIKANDQGVIILIFTDWRKKEYEKKKYNGFIDAPNYPIRSVEIPITMWDFATTEKWILRKITEYKLANMLTDKELPPCTDRERWMKTKKKGNIYTKCQDYCNAAPFCWQWKNTIKGEK